MAQSKSSSEWQALVAQFEETGHSVAVFCRDQELIYSQFLYWVRKLDKTKTKMIPVKVASAETSLAIIELGHGRQLKIVSLDGLRFILNNLV